MKNKSHILLVIVGITAILFAGISCNKEDAPDCFQSAGEYTTVRRDITAFDLIELRDYIQLELHDTDVYFVEITAPENLISDISTDISSGKMLIQNNNRCNWVRSYKNKITVRIHAPEFPEIENFGTGDISSIGTLEGGRIIVQNRHSAGLIKLDVNLDTLSIYMHTGVSDALLNGQATTTELFNQGLGFVDARNLQSMYTFCNNSSINDMYLRADQYLYAFIQFSGNIFVGGDPEDVDLVVEGDGELISIP
jgi:hypothetical protein